MMQLAYHHYVDTNERFVNARPESWRVEDKGDTTMSQQEFVPRSQSNGQDALNDEDEIYQPQYPYHWSGKLDKEAAPRDEPPSSYAEPTLQRGYQAQDYSSAASQQNSTTNNAGQQWPGSQNRGARQQFAPDGDAFEHGYNVGQAGQRGVPPWARPQFHKRGSFG